MCHKADSLEPFLLESWRKKVVVVVGGLVC